MDLQLEVDHAIFATEKKPSKLRRQGFDAERDAAQAGLDDLKLKNQVTWRNESDEALNEKHKHWLLNLQTSQQHNKQVGAEGAQMNNAGDVVDGEFTEK